MNEKFRDKVQNMASDSLSMIDGYFKGGPGDPLKVKSAMQMITQGVKIEHMNQLKEHGDKSLALRLFQFLPKDDKIRREYIKITNPELKPLLLARPKK